MSLFDNDIIDKDPQEQIWQWLDNHYSGNIEVLKEVLNINKRGYINAKKRFPLRYLDLNEGEIVPAYIKFLNNDITMRCVKFLASDINESSKDLIFGQIIGKAHNVHIKAYDYLFLEGNLKNITIKFLAQKPWKLSLGDLRDLSEITIEANEKYIGNVVCSYEYDILKSPKDLKNIQRMVKEFFERCPRCKKIQVENSFYCHQFIEFKAHDSQIEMILHDERI